MSDGNLSATEPIDRPLDTAPGADGLPGAVRTRSRFRRALHYALVRAGLVAGGTVAVLLLLEVGLRLFLPQAVITPRFDFQPYIGVINHPNVTVRHFKPGVYHFAYTINADRYRGGPVAFDSPTSKIVNLGDSYGFGFGVQEEETYSSLLNERLAGRYELVNLANGGWGLPQEIVRYLTFGAKFRPRIVILQFCENDIDDGMMYPVAVWDAEAGGFAMRPVQLNRIGRIRRLLDRVRPVYSFLADHSQVYRFVRFRLYAALESRDRRENFGHVQTTGAPDASDAAAASLRQKGERYHAELLEHFARLLHDSGTRLILISVPGHLEKFSIVRARVEELQGQGLLTYLDTRERLAPGTRWFSDEGHLNPKAHALIAGQLAGEILGR